MYEREFCIYHKPNEKKKFTLDREGDYVLEFQDMGFNFHTELLEPYFYNNQSGIPMVQIQIFTNEKDESIVTFWDSTRELFSFYCENTLQRMHCIKELTIIARNMVSIEKDLKKLCEED